MAVRISKTATKKLLVLIGLSAFFTLVSCERGSPGGTGGDPLLISYLAVKAQGARRLLEELPECRAVLARFDCIRQIVVAGRSIAASLSPTHSNLL